MEMNLAALFFMLLIASSSLSRTHAADQLKEENMERTVHTGRLKETIKAGHGGEGVGEPGNRFASSSLSDKTPGSTAIIPIYGAGAANNHNRHQHGAGIHGHSCNLSVLTAAIFLSFLFSLQG